MEASRRNCSCVPRRRKVCGTTHMCRELTVQCKIRPSSRQQLCTITHWLAHAPQRGSTAWGQANGQWRKPLGEPSTGKQCIQQFHISVLYCSAEAHDGSFPCASSALQICVHPPGPLCVEGASGWTGPLRYSHACPSPLHLVSRHGSCLPVHGAFSAAQASLPHGAPGGS
jgi:hypothetical protein